MARKIGMMQERTVSEVQGGVVQVVHVAGRRCCLACAGRNNISSTSNQVIDPTTYETDADVNSYVDNINAEVSMNNRYHINARNTEMSNSDNLLVDPRNPGTVNPSINNNNAQNQLCVSANHNTEMNPNTGQTMNTNNTDQIMNTNNEDQDERGRRRSWNTLRITLLIHHVTNTIFL